MPFDIATFTTGYVDAFGKLTPKAGAGLKALVQEMVDEATLKDVRLAAYMLATVKHECADTWLPIYEMGSKAYFQKYEPDTPIGSRLGNTEAGDGYLFRGRGYVQLTGRANYARMTKVLALAPAQDLVANPDEALDPEVAYAIMSVGMRKGAFTGRKLSEFLSAAETDYVNARRVVNGVDKAAKIAGYAKAFEKLLATAGW